jgi:endonuclease/exonuclease/phosphatase family metal-dependent hydrolase
MRLATLNVENLFRRPVAMSLPTWKDGREILADFSRLNDLIARETYDGATRQRLKGLLDKYEFGNRRRRDRSIKLTEVRGHLFKVPKGKQTVEIVAAGRNRWVGWFDLEKADFNPDVVSNTGRVIRAVRPDLLCTVEVEDRVALRRFNQMILKAEFGLDLPHTMLVDGNDPRGIDIGLLSRFPILSVRSFADVGGDTPVFSRDCPEYHVALPGGSVIVVLGNHLKSKGYGSLKESAERRRRQAEEVKRIYTSARKDSEYVAVCGDLNDSPDSRALAPLLKETDLRDVMTHDLYTGRPGTFGSGRSPKQKLDYILLSPALWQKVMAVDVERRGIYAPRSIASFPEVTAESSASDHAAVWVDLAL